MIKLYWNIGSQPARAVKALLNISKVEHEAIVIDLKKNETRSAEFLKINPLGQIPFMVTENGLGIGESNAIMQYLCEKYP
jgi:glutathione S-transferase